MSNNNNNLDLENSGGGGGGAPPKSLSPRAVKLMSQFMSRSFNEKEKAFDFSHLEMHNKGLEFIDISRDVSKVEKLILSNNYISG